MKIPPWVTKFFTKGGYIDDEGHVDTRRLLLHSILLMLLILILYWGASRIYLALGWNHNTKLREFVEQFGVLGVAIYVYVVDLLVLRSRSTSSGRSSSPGRLPRRSSSSAPPRWPGR